MRRAWRRRVYGEQMEAMKPIVQPGGSDSAALDNVFEAMVGVGRNLPMVKALLIPDVWAGRETMPKAHRDFYSYCNSVMEPWDGPAAICAFAGNWVIAGMDRNGLRPMRYTITGDGLLLAGSEAGMVRVDETTIVEKGRVGPGQMIGVDLAEGRLYRTGELHGPAGGPGRLQRLGQEHHRHRQPRAQRAGRARDLRARGAAPPPARRRASPWRIWS